MGEGSRAAAAGLIVLRPAELTDIESLVRIERASFSDPWSASALASAIVGPDVMTMVAEADGPSGKEIAGYFVLARAADEAELLNIAVVENSRRQGLGAALLNRALMEAGALGARALFLEVRDSNMAARALYRAAGFSQVGRRKGYYRRPVEDALILRREITRD